ncbi:MAG: aspartate/glutamate racemase family protein, partial [Candidatus Levyibacteriota bacterium]
VLNMIQLTAQFIVDTYGENATVGLLATDGTLQTQIYQKEFAKISPNIKIIAPDAPGQKNVMEAIYGEKGIKAGCIDEHNYEMLNAQAKQLIDNGAQIAIEGCTEIPLVLSMKGSAFPIIDPMEVLAKEIIKRTMASKK